MMRYRAVQRGVRRTLMSQYADSLGHAIARHRAEVALRAANVEAEMASRARAAFVANMSHELRTPLNAIIGFSDVLRDVEADKIDHDHVAEFTDYIHSSAVNLLGMINKLLELTKIHSGSISLTPETIDLAEIIDACFALVRDRAGAANISLAQTSGERVGPAQVDPVRTRQLLLNLIDNAVKFSRPGGSVTVDVASAPSGRIAVSIADEGIGMSEKDIETVLSRFGQIDSGLDRRYDGTGTGLPIAKALTELQGGVLTIQSQPGRGTEVRVLLPAAARAATTDRKSRIGALQ